jgi:hypothetical protein
LDERKMRLEASLIAEGDKPIFLAGISRCATIFVTLKEFKA